MNIHSIISIPDCWTNSDVSRIKLKEEKKNENIHQKQHISWWEKIELSVLSSLYYL